MAQLEAADFADLVVATQRNLGRLRFQQIAQNLTRYEVMHKWFRKGKVVFESGRGIQRTLMTKLSDQAEWVGLLDTVSVDIPDLLDQMHVDFRHLQAVYALEYRADVLMNSGPEKIVSVIEARRADALISLAKQLEAKFWSVPSPSNKTEPYGLPYWLPPSSESTAGFHGGLPHDGTTAHTSVAGVSMTDSPNFKSYWSPYTTVSKGDLIKKMKNALRAIDWRPPVTNDDFRNGRDIWCVYANNDTVASFEDIGEAQNENLGPDMASVRGASTDIKKMEGFTTTFRGFPIIHIPQMDESSFLVYDNGGTSRTDPVYLVDHSTFYPVVLKGDYLRESEPIRKDRQPNLWYCTVDLSTNSLCIDRRRNAVFAV